MFWVWPLHDLSMGQSHGLLWSPMDKFHLQFLNTGAFSGLAHKPVKVEMLSFPAPQWLRFDNSELNLSSWTFKKQPRKVTWTPTNWEPLSPRVQLLGKQIIWEHFEFPELDINWYHLKKWTCRYDAGQWETESVLATDQIMWDQVVAVTAAEWTWLSKVLIKHTLCFLCRGREEWPPHA